MKLLLAFFVFAIVSQVLWAHARTVSGLVFATVPAEGECPAVELKLDAVVPDGDGPYPCLVYFFGGAWCMGKRSQVPPCMLKLAKKDWVLVSSDYRLTQDGKCPFPAQIRDCKEVVRYLRKNAKSLKIDPERIYVSGASAGGHLAALVGVTSGIDPFSGDAVKSDPDSRVAGVVDIFGPTDMKTLIGERINMTDAQLAKPDLITKAIISFFATKDSEVIKSKLDFASPLSYITKERAKDIPPFAIFHSEGDPLVPIAQSELLDKKLKSVGVKSEFKRYKGKTHYLPPAGWNDLVTYLLGL